MVVASTESLLPEEKPKNKMIQSRTETALDLASFITSAVPWIGGPVSNVLGGISTGRKFDRVRASLTRSLASLPVSDRPSAVSLSANMLRPE